jgi:chromate reductase
MTSQPEATHSILAISGSLRRQSSNTGLVRMAQRLAPADVTFTHWDRLGELPYYNEDLEADPPAVVHEWRDAVSAADAVFVAAPEYNFGPTGVLKNAIDWVTRPLGQHALRGKRISIVSSAGSTGGAHMIEQLSGILALLGNQMVSEPVVQIPKGAERISADGMTTDPDIEELIGQRLAALLAVD